MDYGLYNCRMCMDCVDDNMMCMTLPVCLVANGLRLLVKSVVVLLFCNS